MPARFPMIANHLLPPMFESVGAGLLKAGWIEIYTLEDRSGEALRWTPTGVQKLLFLRPMIEEFELANEVDAAMRFTQDCQNQPAKAVEDSKSGAAKYWLACLEELSLATEINSLWRFVLLITGGDRISSLPGPSPELDYLRLNDTLESHGGSKGQRIENE